MEKEIKNTVLIIDKATDERFEFILPDQIEALKDYLAEPDKYDAVFRECAWISKTTLREAYDFAKAHPDDNFYLDPNWMLPGDLVNETAQDFMAALEEEVGEIKEDYKAEKEAWSRSAQDFLWASRLSADEEQTVRKKYGI